MEQPSPAKNARLGYFYLFIGIFTWATIEIVIKLLQGAVSPYVINYSRMVLGSMTLFVYIFLTKKGPNLLYLLRTYPWQTIIASIIGLAIGLSLYTYGTTGTRAAIAATIFSFNPVIVAIYMMNFGGESRNIWKWIGVILGFLGVLIIITQFNFVDFFKADYFMGNLLVFLGMILWCIHIIVGKNLFNITPTQPNSYKITSLDYNALTFFIAAVVMTPIMIFNGEFSAFTSISEEIWLQLLYLGIITTGFGYLWFFKGLALMDASKGINAFYFKPILATIMAFFILGDVPNVHLFIGIGIEIIALLLVSKKE